MSMRRVCFLGTAITPDRAAQIPEGVEIWVANEAYRSLPEGRSPARVFQMHPRDWREAERRYLYGDGRLPDDLDQGCFGRNLAHLEYLKACGVTVFGQQRWGDIPTSVRYPFEQVTSSVGVALPPDGKRRLWATSSWGYMAALLLTEHAAAVWSDVEPIGELLLYGIELPLGTQRERLWEWPNLAYYLGMARGRGIHVTLPEYGSSLLSSPHYALDGRPKPRDPDHWHFPGEAAVIRDVEAGTDREQVYRLGGPLRPGE